MYYVAFYIKLDISLNTLHKKYTKIAQICIVEYLSADPFNETSFAKDGMTFNVIIIN